MAWALVPGEHYKLFVDRSKISFIIGLRHL